MIGKTSRAALLITWLSIPSMYLIPILFAYIPRLIRVTFSKAVRESIMESVGASDMSEVNVSGYIFDQIFGAVPGFVWVLVAIPLVLLFLVWLGFCLVMTHRHFRYHLAVTDLRVIGNAAGKELNAPLNEIVNVFVEQSVWGKLLRYGAITVQTKKKSLTFYNVAHPERLYQLLMSYAENYCAH